MQDVRITVVVDNHARPGLLAEHGLCFWVETASGAVLFDSGLGEALPHNSQVLNIPLASAKAAVLSHGHYDHTGGLPFFLEQNQSAPVYLHSEAFVRRYSIREGKARSIGMPDPVREQLLGLEERLRWVAAPVEILPGLHLTGPIPRTNDFEDVGGPFFLDEQGLQADTIPDDQALWIEHPAGPIVVLGCAHSGVVNTCNYIRTLSGADHLQAVVGGLHLNAASADRLERTAHALEAFKMGRLAPCHCTGAEAVHFLQQRMPECVIGCAAGQVITFT